MDNYSWDNNTDSLDQEWDNLLNGMQTKEAKDGVRKALFGEIPSTNGSKQNSCESENIPGNIEDGKS